VICDPCAFANYIKTSIPVKTEVIMVADVKYDSLFVSVLTENM
jgi:hypothetical protein